MSLAARSRAAQQLQAAPGRASVSPLEGEHGWVAGVPCPALRGHAARHLAVFIPSAAWKAPPKRRLLFLAPALGFPALSFFPGCLPRWPRAHGKGIRIGRRSGYSPATAGAGQASARRTGGEHPKTGL